MKKIDNGLLRGTPALLSLNVQMNKLETLTFYTFQPIMDNLVNSSSELLVNGKWRAKNKENFCIIYFFILILICALDSLLMVKVYLYFFPVQCLIINKSMCQLLFKYSVIISINVGNKNIKWNGKYILQFSILLKNCQ